MENLAGNDPDSLSVNPDGSHRDSPADDYLALGGARKRRLTERAREHKTEELTKFFWRLYNRYASQVTEGRANLDAHPEADVLTQMTEDLTAGFKVIEEVYEELNETSIGAPDQSVRFGIDRLQADKDALTSAVRQQLNTDNRSVCSVPASSAHSRRSGSSSSSARALEAAATVATRRAELQARRIEDKREEELNRLEMEETKRRAEADLEVQQKRRQLNQDRIQRELLVEEARLRVYDEGTQPQPFVRQAMSETAASLPQPPRDLTGMVDAFAAAMSLARLPPPEPKVFDGDPLKYHDWSVAFKVLIEDKKIATTDKIHYLERYVSGPTREAISGYFLLRGANAFEQARALLEERYGNQFVISEAFRDKLDSWPSIPEQDGNSLRRFSDFLNQCRAAMIAMKGLDILNDSRENRRILMKLPDSIAKRWSRIVATTKREMGVYPSFSRFAEYLTEEARIACDPITSIESLRRASKRDKQPSRDDKGRRNPTARTLVSDALGSDIPSCILCMRNSHTLTECRTFSRKPSGERRAFVLKKGLCFGCLRHGHIAGNCSERSTCKTCQGRHPTSLHVDRKPPSEPPQPTEVVPIASASVGSGVCSKVSNAGVPTMLAMIVPVWISAKNNPEAEHLVYALLDTQSDTTFALEDTINALHVQLDPTKLRLSTMSGRDRPIACNRVTGLRVRNYYNDNVIDLPITYTRDFIPTDRSHIPTSADARRWPHLQKISHLIPPLQECEVGLLIGYNCPMALAPRNFITGDCDEPFAIQTDLGWSLIGGTDVHEDSDSIGVSHRIIVKEIPDILRTGEGVGLRSEASFVARTTMKEVMDIPPHEAIRVLESDFKEEEMGDRKLSYDDMTFIRRLDNDTCQQPDGHYSMPLPFRTRPLLPNNRRVAIRRAEHLERRFRMNKQYYEDYKAFLKEMIDRGHAEKVPENEIDEPAWYIPHHGVYSQKRPDKIRIVFDCSAKCQGTSLNEHLLQGPDLTNSLTGVMMRFRREGIAIMCDVEKMFHQFKVHERDRNYLRFLWMGEEYRMTVHLFGASSSPGCANYGLKRIVTDYGDGHSEASHFIRRNFYVDDGLTSVSSVDGAKTLISETRELCGKGKLRLHKFISNSREVIKSIPVTERADDLKLLDLSLDSMPVERVLGVTWCVETDTFQFRLNLQDRPLTRRGVLSTVASIYDPLGFLAPFTLIGKHILQQMCKEHADWDEPLPDDLCQKWNRWKEELHDLASLQIQRCFTPENFGNVKRRELHHFSDASNMGYGQCTYLRQVNEDNEVHCSLVIGKARVTPLRYFTVPRLELQAAVLSVRVSDFLKQELELGEVTEHFWTDSKVVIGYISNDVRRFHVYVANRVQRIRDTTVPVQWRYVKTDENPADHASRGLGATDLSTSNWFSGPAFLWEKEVVANMPEPIKLLANDPELRQGHCHLAAEIYEGSTMPDRLEHFSDWSRAVRAIALLQHFVRRRKMDNPDIQKTIVEEDINQARMTIIRWVQHGHFQDIVEHLQTDKDTKFTSTHNSLTKLDPFLDNDGILRVGGRLNYSSSLCYSVKHPTILPRKRHVTELVIRHCHEAVHHQGRWMTVNEIRSNGYWVIGITSAVSSHIHRCVQCRKLRPQMKGQKMASLPMERVEPSAPFTYCGFDCFGPFNVKEGRKELKKYGLLFTCMSSRAVHIEMLDDMSTDAFINALRCFFALRGSARQLRSDQGSNFVGAKNELARALMDMIDPKVRRYLQTHGCDLVLNIPAASHMGGLWERQIRTVRAVLREILNRADSRLDTSSLRTFLYEVIAIVNSRPLAIENISDPCGPEALTPNHLLTMKTGVVLPPPGEFEREDLYARKRWRRVQYLVNLFWHRWQREYLTNLQVRQKWTKISKNLKPGDIVLLRDEDMIRSRWRLAKIIETMPSKDGLVRKVRLLMSDSTTSKEGKRTREAIYVERPVHKLVLVLEDSPTV